MGATTAQRLAERDYADIVLVDIVDGMPQGKALDLNQSGPVVGYEPKMIGTNGYEETSGSDIVVITSGFPRQPGMSRDDLLAKNKEIVGGGSSGRRGPGRPRGSTTARRGPGRPKGSTTRRRSTNGRRRRRGRRGGTRAEQALKVVRDNPGISVSEMAGKMSIKQPNYLYRVMNQLESDGSVKKAGKGYTAK